MKEIELEVQESVTEVGRNVKLRKSSPFVERKKREARLRRRKTLSNSSTSFLLIAGTTKTVHAVKEKFQERILVKSIKDNKSKQPEEILNEKLHLQKQSETTQETSNSVGSQSKPSTDKLIQLPIISTDSNSNDVKDEKNSCTATRNNLNLPGKNKQSRKRHWKPTSSFRTTLPPIAENDLVRIPSAVEAKVEVTRTQTPLPLL